MGYIMIKNFSINGVINKTLIIFICIVIIMNFMFSNYSVATTVEDDTTLDDIQGELDEIAGGQKDEIATDDEAMLGQTIQNIFNAVPEEQDEEGGELFTPISQFILGIADGVMATMQSAFLGNEKLSNLITSNAIKKTSATDPNGNSATIYVIKYSPATIFSGKIPALDINIFNPMGDENGKTTFEDLDAEYTKVENMSYTSCRQNYGATNNLQSIRDNMSLKEIIAHGIALVCAVNAVEALTNDDADFEMAEVAGASVPVTIPDLKAKVAFGLFLSGVAVAEGVAIADALKDQNIYYTSWEYNNETYFFISSNEKWLTGSEREAEKGTLYKIEYDKKVVDTYEKTSTAFTLAPVIATWYEALKQFALVGLLSALVYVGIRILISSTAQDKAKYKKMLLDWITAVCILYILHYLMVIILDITQKITNVFTITTISPDGTDKFVTNIRNMITGNNNDSYFQYFGYVILYIAITILTVTFTIQYIKRLVMISFLTMIAPLIALTYPLDKIKDGQAQAFTIWLREYIFNSLLQPLHLLLYTIFISSASNLATINPVYAVITLAFFTPAEKFIRKMFGFEKASTVGTLGAAAGGAMVMNLLNKLQGKTVQRKTNETEKANKVRTVDNKNSKKETLTQNGATTEKTPITNTNNMNGNSSGLRATNKKSLTRSGFTKI